MSDNEINIPFNGDGELPIPVPSPAGAWNEMRKKLDDEMPVTGLFFYDVVITAGTSFITRATALVTLLFICSIAWWFNPSHLVKAGKELPPSEKTTANGNDASNAKNTTVNNTPPSGGAASPKTTITHANSNKQGLSKHGSSKNTIAIGKFSTATVTANRGMKDSVPAKQATDTLMATISKPPSVRMPVTAVKKDSIASQSPEEEKEEDTKTAVHAGLQWNIQIPFSGAQHYFAGPTGTSQPYRLLFPSVWLGVEYEKQYFLAEVDLFTTTVYRAKPWTTVVTYGPGQTQTTAITTLNKMFGVSAAARYSYNITDNWWAGVGLHVSSLSRGVVTSDVQVDSGGATIKNTTLVRGLTGDEWAHFSKFRARLDAELLYNTPHWQAGIRAGVYFTPLENLNSAIKNPLQAELFYRWVLWNKK